MILSAFFLTNNISPINKMIFQRYQNHSKKTYLKISNARQKKRREPKPKS